MARERIGPIYIYGPIGAGKTSLLRRLYERLSHDEKYNLALLISPNVKSSNAFLRMIMEVYNVKTERSYDQSLKNFEEFLVKEYKANRIPLLLIDEAQNLTCDVLKMIHYLLNFETATTKLLQIVLVGQVELAARIVRYKELASRMFPIAISAMSPEELEEQNLRKPETENLTKLGIVYAIPRGCSVRMGFGENLTKPDIDQAMPVPRKWQQPVAILRSHALQKSRALG